MDSGPAVTAAITSGVELRWSASTASSDGQLRRSSLQPRGSVWHAGDETAGVGVGLPRTACCLLGGGDHVATRSAGRAGCDAGRYPQSFVRGPSAVGGGGLPPPRRLEPPPCTPHGTDTRTLSFFAVRRADKTSARPDPRLEAELSAAVLWLRAAEPSRHTRARLVDSFGRPRGGPQAEPAASTCPTHQHISFHVLIPCPPRAVLMRGIAQRCQNLVGLCPHSLRRSLHLRRSAC